VSPIGALVRRREKAMLMVTRGARRNDR